MSRPILATIRRQSLVHNLGRVRAAAPAARTWAVIKANAYGHGLLLAAEALAAADGFAILNMEDALRLREAGHHHPILLLEGVFHPAEYAECARLGLIPVIHNERQVQWLEAAQPATPLAVYLKLNTGMNRLGLPPAAVAPVLTRLRALPCVADITWMTHFARADEPGGEAGQWDLFRDIAAAAPALPVCTANSAAILSAPATHGDWVRPGIMLYGSSPFADRSARQLGLSPVMQLTSELLAVQQINAGDAVGYGARFVAPQSMRIGVVACGYADGYPRHAPDGTPIVVGGVRTRVVGRVSMDMLTVDLTPVPGADVGTPVELWGDHVSVDEVAAAAGTIGYELLAALAPRVPLVAA